MSLAAKTGRGVLLRRTIERRVANPPSRRIPFASLRAGLVGYADGEYVFKRKAVAARAGSLSATW